MDVTCQELRPDIRIVMCACFVHALGRPGSDLLSHVLRRSTIGAEGFHGRVRNGIGCRPLAITTRSSKRAAMRLCPNADRADDRRRSLSLRATYQPQIKPNELLVPV